MQDNALSQLVLGSGLLFVALLCGMPVLALSLRCTFLLISIINGKFSYSSFAFEFFRSLSACSAVIHDIIYVKINNSNHRNNANDKRDTFKVPL